MIYGEGDQGLSRYYQIKKNPTWVQDTYTSNLYVENGSIAHLQYEAAMMEVAASGGTKPEVAGRAFLITDSVEAHRFGNFYLALNYLSKGEVVFDELPAVPFLILSYFVEMYHISYYALVDHVPILGGLVKRFVPSLEGTLLINLQPSLFATTCVSLLYNDKPARRPIEEGGIGYNPPFSTLDGVCKFMYQTLEEGIEISERATGNIGIAQAQEGAEKIAEKVGLVN
jgi:hypothetical protein